MLHVHVRTSFFHCSYSLYEPKDIVLSEYKGGLEKDADYYEKKLRKQVNKNILYEKVGGI